MIQPLPLVSLPDRQRVANHVRALLLHTTTPGCMIQPDPTDSASRLATWQLDFRHATCLCCWLMPPPLAWHQLGTALHPKVSKLGCNATLGGFHAVNGSMVLAFLQFCGLMYVFACFLLLVCLAFRVSLLLQKSHVYRYTGSWLWPQTPFTLLELSY